MTEAQAAIDGATGTPLLEQVIQCDYAFVRPPPTGPKKGRTRGRSASPSRRKWLLYLHDAIMFSMREFSMHEMHSALMPFIYSACQTMAVRTLSAFWFIITSFCCGSTFAFCLPEPSCLELQTTPKVRNRSRATRKLRLKVARKANQSMKLRRF